MTTHMTSGLCDRATDRPTAYNYFPRRSTTLLNNSQVNGTPKRPRLKDEESLNCVSILVEEGRTYIVQDEDGIGIGIGDSSAVCRCRGQEEGAETATARRQGIELICKFKIHLFDFAFLDPSAQQPLQRIPGGELQVPQQDGIHNTVRGLKQEWDPFTDLRGQF